MAEHDARAETTSMDGARSERLGRITFRAWRRGFREADMVLGPFIEQDGPSLSDAELDMLEALLAEDDHDIYAWIIESKVAPERHETALMARLRRFMRANVAAAVSKGIG